MASLTAPQFSHDEDERANRIWNWYLRIADAVCQARFDPAPDWNSLRAAARSLIKLATRHLTNRVHSCNLAEPMKPLWLCSFQRLLASACMGAGDNPSADEALRAAIALDPFCVDARVALIALLLEEAEINQAVEQMNGLQGMIHLEGYEMASRVLEWVLFDPRIANQVESAILRECVLILSEERPGAKIVVQEAIVRTV